jgi:pimeloyl-ACP methyl ester carboxylesterase
MHYRDQGLRSGPTVLLIHGYSASLQAWEPLIALLRDRYRFVSIDLPGHGLTRAPADYRPSIERYVSDVAAFVGAERLERFSIAGSSMGGNLAWEYVLAHPQGVAALILVDAAGWPDPRPGAGPPAAIRALLQQPVVGPMLRDLDGTQIMRDGLLQAFADPTLVDEPMVRRYTELARAPGHRAILVELMLARRARRQASDALLAVIRVPTLILHGSRDQLIPVEQARFFGDAIAGSEVVVFDDVGHLPMEERPDRTVAAVAEFLQNSVR